MGKTITLKGDAAKAFIGLHQSDKPKTEEERYAECAVGVALAVKSNDMMGATKLLKAMVAARGGNP